MVSEVLVVGGGLAGAAAALELARGGTPVRLLEREAAPRHKLCGEFLSVEAQRDLCRLGLDPRHLGAVPIDRARLVRGRRQVEAALPFAALGVSRRNLDEALLQAAGREGARIERGVKVTAIDGSEASTSAGSYRAPHMMLATGKHEVRGAKRPGAGAGDGYIGFKMHWRLPPVQTAGLANAIELILFEGGYAGLQRVSGAEANLCLLVRRERLAQSGGRWEGLLADLMREPHIARRLGDAEPLFDRPLTIANLPYGYCCGAGLPVPPGLFRLGDQAALTAPLTGDGMAIALRSARIAAACIEAGATSQDYNRKLEHLLAPQIRRAMFLQRMTESPLAMQIGMRLSALWPAMLASAARATRLAESRREMTDTDGPGFALI